MLLEEHSAQFALSLALFELSRVSLAKHLWQDFKSFQ